MKLNIVKMLFALLMSTSIFSTNLMVKIEPEYITTANDEIEIIFEIPKQEESIEQIENTVEIETVEENIINEEEITETEPEQIKAVETVETVETTEPAVEEPIQNDIEEPIQEIPETVVEDVKQDVPVVVRENNINVNGISVYITNSVTDADYNIVIGWIAEMPSFLTSHINSVNVVDDITQYSQLVSDTAVGLTKGSDIYIKSDNIANRKGNLYHEAGHCLDNYGGYSYTSKWNNICSVEWSGEGYYSTIEESFPEAISHYYVDGLNKPQSLAAIESLINTGALGEDDGFKDNYVTLYAEYKAIWIYSGADDFYNPVITTVEIGDTVQAVALNVDGTWYKVDINGQEGYCRADMVSVIS